MRAQRNIAFAESGMRAEHVAHVVDTNIVQFRIGAGPLGAAELARRMEQRGIRIGVLAPDVLRVVTHLDVDSDDIDETLTGLRAELDASGNRARLRAVQGSEPS